MILASILTSIALVLAAPSQERQHEIQDLSNSLFDNIDLASFADPEAPLYDLHQLDFEEIDYISPAVFEFESQEEDYQDQEGHWELAGYQLIDMPYYELEGGSIMSVEEYENSEEQDYNSKLDLENYTDEMDNSRIASSQAASRAGRFFKKVWKGVKKVAKVALPIMKFIPGPIGLAARAISYGCNDY